MALLKQAVSLHWELASFVRNAEAQDVPSQPGSSIAKAKEFMVALTSDFDLRLHASMTILARWCIPGPEGMGTAMMWKTVQILEYDPSLDSPNRTYIVLRCWALWRAQQGDWLNHHPLRQRWYQHELADLRAAVSKLGTPKGTTGCAAADMKVREWAPAVLQ